MGTPNSIECNKQRDAPPPYAYGHGIGIQELQADWRLDQDEIAHKRCESESDVEREARPAQSDDTVD